MTFYLGLFFNSVQCCSLGYDVFWVLIFQIGRTSVITWGSLASQWPGLLLFLMALGKAVSSWEQWAAGNGISLRTSLVWKPWKKSFLGVNGSPSSFPFQLLSIPLQFVSSHPSSCRLAWRWVFLAPSCWEQQRSPLPVLLGSLAQVLLMAAASKAEGVDCRMQNCISETILMKNHLKMGSSFIVYCFFP